MEHVANDDAILKKLNAGVSTVLIPAIYSYQNYSFSLTSLFQTNFSKFSLSHHIVLFLVNIRYQKINTNRTSIQVCLHQNHIAALKPCYGPGYSLLK